MVKISKRDFHAQRRTRKNNRNPGACEKMPTYVLGETRSQLTKWMITLSSFLLGFLGVVMA